MRWLNVKEDVVIGNDGERLSLASIETVLRAPKSRLSGLAGKSGKGRRGGEDELNDEIV